MPRVYYSTILSATVEEAWEVVRDFNGLPKWHPGITASELEDACSPDCEACIGSVRHFQLANGEWMREQLLSLSDLDFSVSYTILETGMKLKNYVATLKLTPVTATDETFAEWEAVFDATDPIPAFEKKVLEAGVMTREDLDAMKAAAVRTIGEAIEYARKSPEPDASELYTDLYVPAPAGAETR